MQLKIQISIVLTFLILTGIAPANAQKTQISEPPASLFQDAIDRFQKQKYASARETFDLLSDLREPKHVGIATDAKVYSALCAIELFHKDAEAEANFVYQSFPAHPYMQDLAFKMARNLYQKKNYDHCLDWLNRIDKSRISREDICEFEFKKGYCHFVNEDLTNAKLCFFEVKDVDCEYNPSANYFYAHIAYSEKNFQTALLGFKKLTKDELFAPVVPYYITQIFFLQKKFDELLEFAPAVLDSASPARAAEISRFIGEAYFQTQRFEQAIPFLLKSRESVTTPTPEEDYQLAYAFYQTGQWEPAAPLFEKASFGNDSLAQNAYYHLGDCFIRLNDKSRAQMAFSAASRLKADRKVREEALFQFAKLSFDLSYSPFNQTIVAFNEFVTQFPLSDHIQEAFTYLVKVYMVTRNYGEALSFIEKIDLSTVPDSLAILKAYQRVLFFRGVEFFNELRLDEAISLFSRSLDYGRFDSHIRSQAQFWKAEALFRQKDFPAAAREYKEYTRMPGTFGTHNYHMAHYGMAYCAYNQKETQSAIGFFRKFTNDYSNRDRFLADGFLRLGDCFYLNRNYPEAVAAYQNALDLATPESDYALFQKAFNHGLMSQDQKKIEDLQILLRKYPNSPYSDDAQNEIARTYNKTNTSEMAIEHFNKVIFDYPNSEFVKSASLQLALLYYNTDKNDQALSLYKSLIEKFPNSPEAKSALLGIKNIYIDLHEEDTFFEYSRSLGDFASVSASEQDSLVFFSAEKLYMSEDYKRAAEHFGKYIRNFPKGEFLLNTLYFKADCHVKLNEEDLALESYKAIIALPTNQYTSGAVREAARMEYRKKNMEEALLLFEKLESTASSREETEEALVNQMRANYSLNKFENTVRAGAKVLQIDGLPEEILRETRYKLAKSHYALQQFDQALGFFRSLSGNVKTREGAESKYRVAEILFFNQLYAQSEKEILDFNQGDSPHAYWIAKAILLLGDIYIKKVDLFQARHTFQSVLDNYELVNDGILDETKTKLREVETLEEAERQRIQDEKEAQLLKETETTLFPDSLLQPLPENQTDTIQRPGQTH
jgi:TolA-binding protein